MKQSPEGVHNNSAERYFSRARRWQYGTSHGARPTYLMDYMTELA